MSDTLVIPSAVTVPDELKLDVGSIPTGLIPLHGQPVVKHIIDSFRESDDCGDIDVVIAHHPDFDALVTWANTSDYDIDLVEVPAPDTLARTVATALGVADQRGILGEDGAYIQFADTLIYPPCVTDDEDSVVYDDVDHPIRWTTFETDESGGIETISEKFTDVSRKRAKTFVGQFWFGAPREFEDALTRAMATAEGTQNISEFYIALLSYLSDRTYRLRSPDRWIDIGHLDTYYRAKLDFLNTREFNDLRIDRQTGVICKRSENVDILNAEVNWYDDIPPAIQPYTPEIYEFERGTEPLVRMEYIGYPPLSDIHLYGSHGIHIWKSIFRNLFRLIGEFREYSTDKYTPAEVESSLRSMYVDKTLDRLDVLRTQPGFARFFDAESVVVNGEEFRSVGRIVDRLADDLQSTDLFELDEPTMIHGDFCFPNILYDIRTGNVKLIDPRGEFGALGIYGDYRYDLAKLIHSVDGHYEFIINDRFSVDASEHELSYRIHLTEQHHNRRQLFDSMLESRYPNERADLYALESLLWLSMVALHSDEPDRQRVMLAQGIEKYNRTFINQ